MSRFERKPTETCFNNIDTPSYAWRLSCFILKHHQGSRKSFDPKLSYCWVRIPSLIDFDCSSCVNTIGEQVGLISICKTSTICLKEYVDYGRFSGTYHRGVSVQLFIARPFQEERPIEKNQHCVVQVFKQQM